MQVSSKLDETSRNRVWREHISKEAASQTLAPSKYSLTNPQKSAPPDAGQLGPLPALAQEHLAAAVDLLPEKPNKTVPVFARPGSSDLKHAGELLASYSNAKNTYKARGRKLLGGAPAPQPSLS